VHLDVGMVVVVVVEDMLLLLCMLLLSLLLLLLLLLLIPFSARHSLPLPTPRGEQQRPQRSLCGCVC
jgi:hypothetical protein